MLSNESLQHQLYALEERLLQPEVRKSSSELTKLLADEFVEFGSSGHVHDRQSIIAELSRETPVHISIVDFKATTLAPDAVLVTYRAVSFSENQETTRPSLRSSIWMLAKGNWQLVFHQGTPMAAP